MRLSMTLPTMAGGIDRGLLRAWCQAVDEGPFHALAVGERIGFDNLEMHTTLTFAAAAQASTIVRTDVSWSSVSGANENPMLPSAHRAARAVDFGPIALAKIGGPPDCTGAGPTGTPSTSPPAQIRRSSAT